MPDYNNFLIRIKISKKKRLTFDPKPGKVKSGTVLGFFRHKQKENRFEQQPELLFVVTMEAIV